MLPQGACREDRTAANVVGLYTQKTCLMEWDCIFGSVGETFQCFVQVLQTPDSLACSTSQLTLLSLMSVVSNCSFSMIVPLPLASSLISFHVDGIRS